MCKHLLNSQVYIQAPCCMKWYECSECHDEVCEPFHIMEYSTNVRFTCKCCKKCFIRDFSLFSEKDKYCGQCNVR